MQPPVRRSGRSPKLARSVLEPGLESDPVTRKRCRGYVWLPVVPESAAPPPEGAHTKQPEAKPVVRDPVLALEPEPEPEPEPAVWPIIGPTAASSSTNPVRTNRRCGTRASVPTPQTEQNPPRKPVPRQTRARVPVCAHARGHARGRARAHARERAQVEGPVLVPDSGSGPATGPIEVSDLAPMRGLDSGLVLDAAAEWTTPLPGRMLQVFNFQPLPALSFPELLRWVDGSMFSTGFTFTLHCVTPSGLAALAAEVAAAAPLHAMCMHTIPASVQVDITQMTAPQTGSVIWAVIARVNRSVGAGPKYIAFMAWYRFARHLLNLWGVTSE